MTWMIPGTVLHADRSEADQIPQQLEALFFGGGITLSQVTAITGLEPHTVQNWVKRRFVTSPEAKRYSLRQLCRIININLLKGALQLDEITRLLSYINGDLTDESDDLVDDTQLFFMFVKLAARARHIGGTQEWGAAMEEVVQDYVEPVPGAKERLVKVLRIMLTAWIASRLRQQAEDMLKELN